MEVRDGYKMTKVGVIPEEWEVTKLELLMNITSSKRIMQSEYLEEGIPFYRSKEIIELSKGKKITSQYFISLDRYNKIKTKFNAPREGEILITAVGTLGITYLINKKDIPFYFKDGNLIWLNNFPINFNNTYFVQLTKSKLFKNLISRNTSGSSQKALTMEKLRNFKIPLPPLPEQKKIASILSTVDEQIQNTQNIITETQALKKGLMQKLFSEGIGHTEFKETKVGRIPAEWELISLKEISEIYVGRDLDKESFSPDKNINYKYPVYSNTVSNRGLYGYYNKYGLQGKSLTIVGRGVGLGTAFSRDEEYNIIGRLLSLFPKENIDNDFLTYFINHKINFAVESSGIPQLTGKQVGTYKVAIPSLKEQIQIAKILTQTDQKIQEEKANKARLEELKKGLMQVLLTGQVRVKV